MIKISSPSRIILLTETKKLVDNLVSISCYKTEKSKQNVMIFLRLLKLGQLNVRINWKLKRTELDTLKTSGKEISEIAKD